MADQWHVDIIGCRSPDSAGDFAAEPSVNYYRFCPAAAVSAGRQKNSLKTMNWSATLQAVGFRRHFLCRKTMQVIVFINILMLARCLQYLMAKIEGKAMRNEKIRAKNHNGFAGDRPCGQPRIDKHMK